MPESQKCITVSQNQNNNKQKNIPNKPGAMRMACYKQTKKRSPQAYKRRVWNQTRDNRIIYM